RCSHWCIPCTILPDSSFFFSSRRRHTRFSRDWSSDVCSSDLTCHGISLRLKQASSVGGTMGSRLDLGQRECPCPEAEQGHGSGRSEERRVGKEGRSRWPPYEERNKKREVERGAGVVEGRKDGA